MSRIRIFIVLLILLSQFSTNLFSQSKILSKKEITALTKQASNYLHESNFEKSFAASRISLENAIAINDDYLIAKSYNIIGANYEHLSEFDKAIFYYNKGLDYAEKTNNDTIKNWITNNLGNVYCFEKEKFDEGLKFFKRSLEYSEQIADSSQIYLTKMNVAWAYFYIGDFKSGKTYLDFINKQEEKFGDESLEVALNMLNGMFYTNNLEFDKADSFFQKAINFGNKEKEKSDLSYAYEEYAKLLFKKGDYKKAYENLLLFHKIRKEIENSVNLKRANVVGVNLELDEFKRKISSIETENDLQSQSIKKSKVIVFLFVIALSILLLLLRTLYRNNIFKKKTNAELMLANEQLNVAVEKAEVASQLKTQFVSTISHELRTPLYGVVGITNMLLDEHKELAGSPHLNSLKFSARYLLSLVNDILQINKIEENRIVLESLTFNILDEINMIKNSLSFIAQNNNNILTVNVDPRIPEYLIGDKLRLAQVLMNLISNALKFTKNGEVNIIINLLKVENKAHFIEFKIKDNGTGIAEADQIKIFDKFVQVGTKENDYQGTGLGLSIVKQLLVLFKSKISLESKIGKGTTFAFTIIFDHDPDKTNEIINNIQVDLRSSQLFKILVVEDNKINQIVTKKTLEKHNCSCFLVDDGYQALEILEKETFDVILMDINMPLMNGFETTRKIRLRGFNVPIIALTAFNKEEITEEALSAGMNDIIVKPFEPVTLFKIISTQIKRNADNDSVSLK